ncbi:MAG: hypothetical protein Q4A79_02195 [Candidatus Saccharibacteria bacterium]|nr:hypothetical protein [Candidatus Saccharibacteria bacterium]
MAKTIRGKLRGLATELTTFEFVTTSGAIGTGTYRRGSKEWIFDENATQDTLGESKWGVTGPWDGTVMIVLKAENVPVVQFLSLLA